MKLHYQARTKAGQIQSGVIEASSKEAAIDTLRAHNLYVTALREVRPPLYAREIRFGKGVSKKEIVALSRQLSIMFKSEIPLVEIFQTLAKQTKNSRLREKILEIVEKIEGGAPLSKTFGLYPEIFSSFYVNMVKSGEASGKLSDVFLYLADHQEKEYNFHSKIKGAMIYPAFVVAVFAAVLIMLITFVLPQLSQFFEQTGGEMPLMTKIVMGSASFLKKWGWLLLLFFLSLAAFIVYYARTREGKIFFDKNLLKTPFLQNFLKKIYLARFALNLSTLLSGGLPVTQALEVTGDVVGNTVYKSLISEIVEGVKKGRPISSLLEKHPREIPPLFVQMVIVGEKTGRLNSALMNIVEFYQKDVDQTVDNLSKILEPIIILCLGLLVAGLMAAVIMPIYQVVTTY